MDCEHCAGSGMICLECDSPSVACDCGDTVEAECAACWDEACGADLADAK